MNLLVFAPADDRRRRDQEAMRALIEWCARIELREQRRRHPELIQAHPDASEEPCHAPPQS